jgi:alkanesulfonate monooxygenase SsuD/methylene tetrahydromethanopterin reductase-like flavin-dependent oxidoreductase (luciferase family)
MRRLWTLDDPSFDGAHYAIGDVAFYPQPIQHPHPPLWFGGNEEPALRRTVRFDGDWHFAYLDTDTVRPVPCGSPSWRSRPARTRRRSR